MISEEISLNSTFNKSTLKYFSPISIRSEQKSKICSSERGSSLETQKGGSSPFNKNKWVTCEWPICKREREQSLLVWLNNEIEVGPSIFVKSCVTYFRDIHPIHVARAKKYSYVVFAYNDVAISYFAYNDVAMCLFYIRCRNVIFCI